MFRKKTIITYLKAKNSLHATRISSFKYVFIVFFEKKQMLKYTIIVRLHLPGEVEESDKAGGEYDADTASFKVKCPKVTPGTNFEVRLNIKRN